MSIGHWFGWLKDKLGKPAYQIVFVQRVAGGLFDVVRERFFSRDLESFVTPVKRASFRAKVSNTVIKRKQRMIQYVDIDTGDSINFSGKNGTYLTPQELNALLTSNDIKQASEGGSVYDTTFVVIVAVLGVVVGLLVGVLFFPQILKAMGVTWW